MATDPEDKPPPRKPYRFPKGASGNPSGSSKRKRELANLGRLTSEQTHEVAALLLHGNMDALAAVQGNPDASVLQSWTANIILKAHESGDPGAWKILMDRLIGRCRETKELTGAGGGPIVTRVESDEEKLERIEALRKAREELGRG